MINETITVDIFSFFSSFESPLIVMIILTLPIVIGISYVVLGKRMSIASILPLVIISIIIASFVGTTSTTTTINNNIPEVNVDRYTFKEPIFNETNKTEENYTTDKKSILNTDIFDTDDLLSLEDY